MSAAAVLSSSVSLSSGLPGVGLVTPVLGEQLEKAFGIGSVGELLRHFPRRYEDRSNFRAIADVLHGEAVTISGQVVGAENIPTRSKMIITKIMVRDDSGSAMLVFFNQWYLKKQFEKLIGVQIVAFGKASRAGAGGLELSEVEWELVNDDTEDLLFANRIVPIYPLAEGIKQKRLRRLIWDALQLAGPAVVDPLPESMIRSPNLREIGGELLSRVEAYRQIHFPDNFGRLQDARNRLTFDEFFGLQLVLAQRKLEYISDSGIKFVSAQAAVEELASALPFVLTGAQGKVIEEIRQDMESEHPMNRLVQGDVGSGKTVVAMAALVIAVRSGYQAALMAPTEILAEQHYNSITQIMKQLDIPVALVTGSMKVSEKRDMQQCIADGIYPIVIGTHALIQEDVKFHRLGLAIIDEQHRFGVMQRASLRDKSGAHVTPDMLVMTATPIPRTLTLTVYGDLDVSIIDELPPGRKPIRTHWKRVAERVLVYETLRKLLQQGRQAYIICPLVEESDKMQARAATELAEYLRTEIFPDFKVGLLHAQLKAVEKDETMAQFRERQIDILVATTVIEVGVDVPNASIIVIEDAERFGLAQLHQLRGRVGRGETQSYCLLIAEPKTEVGAARMSIIERSSDGFEIAEEDLKLRGPGDFYGTRQSGVELLPFIDVVKDVVILKVAREEAFRVIADDPRLEKREHKGLQELVTAKRSVMSHVRRAN